MFRRLARTLAAVALAVGPVLGAPGFLAPASAAEATYRLYTYDPPGPPAPVHARWNPCAPVTWKVNLAQAGSTPAARLGAFTDLQLALGRISQATGIRFEYGGETDAVPTDGALPSVAPLVIAWARPGHGSGRSPLLRDGAAGWGGISGLVYTAEGRHYYRITSAYAVLDAGQNARFRPGFGPGPTRGVLLLHEISHAMGVGHSDLRSQIMYPTILSRPTTDFGAWDRHALHQVGRASGCVPG